MPEDNSPSRRVFHNDLSADAHALLQICDLDIGQPINNEMREAFRVRLKMRGWTPSRIHAAINEIERQPATPRSQMASLSDDARSLLAMRDSRVYHLEGWTLKRLQKAIEQLDERAKQKVWVPILDDRPRGEH